MARRLTPELRQACLSEGFDEVLSGWAGTLAARGAALRLLEKAGWTVGASSLIRRERRFMDAF